MNNFYEYLFTKHKGAIDMPSNVRIWEWARDVFRLLFPERNAKKIQTIEALKASFTFLENEFLDLVRKTQECENCDHFSIVRDFFEQLPDLYQSMTCDAQTIYEGDPAARSLHEVIRTYPGFLATCIYRMAHKLWQEDLLLIPSILSEYAHERTGIDIHPGAQIGSHFHIDHGTGVVIGETSKIGNFVKIYQGVTLGALSVDKLLAGSQRHPTIEDHVIIYSGATVLGDNTKIGHHSVIGGNVWLTSSIEPYTKVYHQPNIKFIDTSQ